jgi:hypothetical protein
MAAVTATLGIVAMLPGSAPAAGGVGPTVTCTSDPSVFNTAYDASTGGKLAFGATDANWEVTDRTDVPSPPLTTAPPPAGTAWFPATVGNLAPGAWAASPFNNADWISREQGTSPSGDWFYRYRFTLAAEVDPASFALQLDFLADNAVYEVYVNGVPQSSKTIGLPQNPSDPYNYRGFQASNAAHTTLAHDWQTGANEIIVHMKSGAPYEGFDTQARPAGVCATDLNLTGSAPTQIGAGSAIT